jgi:hypothetical protein
MYAHLIVLLILKMIAPQLCGAYKSVCFPLIPVMQLGNCHTEENSSPIFFHIVSVGCNCNEGFFSNCLTG